MDIIYNKFMQFLEFIFSFNENVTVRVTPKKCAEFYAVSVYLLLYACID